MNLHNIIYKIIQYLYKNKLLINIIVNLNKIVSRLNITITADNLLLSVKTIDRLLYSLLLKYKLWDRELIRFIKKTVKKNMVVVDIGANIGVYTLYFSKLVGKGGSVYSIEADKDNYNLLVGNITLNRCNNVLSYCTAIYKKNTEKKFSVNKIHKGDHRLIEGTNSSDDDGLVSVKCSTLDYVLAEVEQKIDLIKIDIQGGEIDALEGMIKLLKKFPQIMIIMEYDSTYMAGNKERFKNICISNKFQIKKIEKDSLISIEASEILSDKKEKYCNIVLQKK